MKLRLIIDTMQRQAAGESKLELSFSLLNRPQHFRRGLQGRELTVGG